MKAVQTRVYFTSIDVQFRTTSIGGITGSAEEHVDDERLPIRGDVVVGVSREESGTDIRNNGVGLAFCHRGADTSTAINVLSPPM